jgi:hypothetical protein
MALFTARARRKLQAANWCSGYAHAGTGHAASVFGKLSYPRKRVSSTPRLLDSITSAAEYWIIRFRG